MNRLRLLLLTAVIWLIVLFVLAYPDALGFTPSPVVFVIAVVTVLSMLIFPDLGTSRLQMILLANGAMYLGAAAAGLLDHDLTELPLVVTELLLLAVTAYLVRLLSVVVANLEQVLENVVTGREESRILSTVMGEETINAELFRARRFNRPVGFILLHLSGVEELKSTRAERFNYQFVLQRSYLKARVGQLAESFLYHTDPIAWHADDLVICLPETNREQAEELARKIYDLIRLQLNIRMPIGVASFPDDGLIYKYLIEAAGKNLLTFASERKGAGGAGAEDKLTTQERAALQPFTVDFGFGKMSGQGELAQPLRKSSSTFILSLGLRALLHGGDLMQPFVAQRPHHHDVSPYYDPDFWVNRLPYQSADSRRVYMQVKRAMDLALVALSLPFVLPLGAALAGLIWLQDRHSPLYVQQRTGLGGRKFKMYKFRSMIVNADQRLAELGVRVNERGETINENGDKLENDPRITPVGRILRKTSLDELPQLWNVLRGDMSIVGPRPTSFGVDKYQLLHTERLSVKPGITGLWQIYERGETDFDNRLIWDMKYIDKISLVLDLKIIVRTGMKIFKDRGAR
ncbi:MAG TPA: sugar transferase [Aggregatilineaceae bacterium]|nr:sugar transferase [Aggregatilineaceae bacterium]